MSLSPKLKARQARIQRKALKRPAPILSSKEIQSAHQFLGAGGRIRAFQRPADHQARKKAEHEAQIKQQESQGGMFYSED